MRNFMMQPWRDLTVKKIEEAKVLISGIAYDLSCSCGQGTGFAPNKLRELSQFLPPATKDGESITKMKIYDFGDIGNNDLGIDKVELKALEILQYDKFPIFIGGDHSVSIPIQKAFYEYYRKQNKIPAIIHIDAHPDFCDIYDNSKYSHACTNFRAYENGYCLEDIVLLGIRGFELQEIELFKKHPEINIYRASLLNEKGMKVINELINKFDERYAIYLSFDIDAIDPSFAPGTGTPEAFGLSTTMTNEIINYFIKNLPVKAMDVVEVAPPLDVNDVTSWTALKIIYEVLNTLQQR